MRADSECVPVIFVLLSANYYSINSNNSLKYLAIYYLMYLLNMFILNPGTLFWRSQTKPDHSTVQSFECRSG